MKTLRRLAQWIRGSGSGATPSDSTPLPPLTRASLMFLLTDVQGTVDALRVVLHDDLGTAAAMHTRNQLDQLAGRVGRFAAGFEEQMELEIGEVE